MKIYELGMMFVAKRQLRVKQPIDQNQKIEKLILDLKRKKSIDIIRRTLPNLLRLYKRQIVGVDFPNNFKELKAVFPPSVGLEKELCWYGCILGSFSGQINQFITLEQDYSAAVLAGDLLCAQRVLNDIQEKFGVSVWLLENKISLLDQLGGIKMQKEYHKSISDIQGLHQQVEFFSYMFSFRAENNVSSKRFEEVLSERIQNVSENYQNYLHFKFNFFGTEEIDSFKTILEMDSGFSIIDRYLTFVRICQLICTKENTKRRNYVLDLVRNIGKDIDDIRLQNMIYMFDFNNAERAGDYQRLLSIYDHYLAGNYCECKKQCEELFNDRKFDCIELYSLYAKNLIRLGEEFSSQIENESLRYIIIKNLIEIFEKKEKSSQAYLELLKIVCNFSSHNWASGLYNVLQENFNANKFDCSMMRYGELNSKFSLGLGKVKLFEDEERKAYILKLASVYPEATSIKLERIFECNCLDEALRELDELALSRESCIKHKAILNEKFDCNNEAIRFFKQLQASLNVMDFEVYATGLTRCYMKEKMLLECAEVIIETVLKNEKLYKYLPCRELVEEIERGSSSHQGEIVIPIVYDLYSKFVSAEKDIAKAERCEDFLNFHEFEKPSEIQKEIRNFDKSKLIYFLKNVCTVHVLENFITFDSSKDIESERLVICQLLMQLDPPNSDKYSREIKEITQKQMLQNALYEIEQSKIYVDVEALKISVSQKLKESFERYKSLPDSVENKYIRFNLGRGEIVLPSNEKFSLFCSMFKELRDEFISSNIYGLDGYVSVRIRHGTLAGQIRSSMVVENLITAKDGETNIYKPNEYWVKKYADINELGNIQLVACLNEFSCSIDQLIDRVKNQCLQVKTENKNEEGLFDFCISDIEFQKFNLEANRCRDYEEFINFGIEELWIITERSLKLIREDFFKTIKNEFNDIFDELVKKVQEMKADCKNEFSELNVSINKARTSLSYELDTIASWFARSHESDIENYGIHLPIEIGISTILHAYPESFSHEINISGELTLKGNTLQSFVDIIYTLLDNIVKHSKMKQKPKVSIDVKYNDELLCLVIKNQVNNTLDIQKENEKLSDILSLLGEPQSWDNVRREGGTGFYKIKKMLIFDLKCRHSLKFRIDDEYNFVVEIQMDTRGLIV